MKGKYANAAEKRRDQESLENRIRLAERERDRLAADLADARRRHEIAVRDQRVRIAALEKERDQAIAPALEDARDALIAMRAEVADLRKAVAQKERSNLRMKRALTVLGSEAGFRKADAVSAAENCRDADDQQAVDIDSRLVAAIAGRAGSDTGKRSVIAFIYEAIADGRYRFEGPSLILDASAQNPEEQGARP